MALTPNDKKSLYNAIRKLSNEYELISKVKENIKIGEYNNKDLMKGTVELSYYYQKD